MMKRQRGDMAGMRMQDRKRRERLVVNDVEDRLSLGRRKAQLPEAGLDRDLPNGGGRKDDFRFTVAQELGCFRIERLGTRQSPEPAVRIDENSHRSGLNVSGSRGASKSSAIQIFPS